MINKFNDLLLKYGTARIDIENIGNSENNIAIIKNSDSNSNLIQIPDNNKKILESNSGFLDLELKCINSGTLNIWFRGIDYRDINNNKFPIYLDYTDIEINNQQILKENKIVSYDEPYLFKKDVKDEEILKIHIVWLPFNNTCEYNMKNSHQNLIKRIESLKKKLLLRENQLKSIPQLSCTSLGYSALEGKLIYRNSTSLNSQRTILNDLNGYCENQWLTQYIRHKFNDADFKINIFAVSNPHDNLTYPMEGKKVLFALEDLNYRYLEMKLHFDKYALNYVDLAMGHDLINHPNYIRFPYWLLSHFRPDVTEEQIENTVYLWNSSNYEKSKDAVVIASHDSWGVRTLIDNDINNLVNVTYAGKWKNNTSDLQKKFNDNKREYLKQFKFNLCAENCISDGYVTEKIFDAITGDSIPLYAGGGNYLEPKIINPKSILRWECIEQFNNDHQRNKQAYYGNIVHSNVNWIADDDANSDTIELFKNLISDKKTYNEFKDQDKVLNSSTKYIINKFSELEKHFERLIYS